MPCRDFTVNATVDGKPETVKGNVPPGRRLLKLSDG
jgi:hypothetical protein